MTVRRSVVGTRLDLEQSLEFARAGKVKAMVAKDKLESINDVFTRMHMREIEGRMFWICTHEPNQWLACQAG
jgi:propanol-preferring alcohol dehydrogenase